MNEFAPPDVPGPRVSGRSFGGKGRHWRADERAPPRVSLFSRSPWRGHCCAAIPAHASAGHSRADSSGIVLMPGGRFSGHVGGPPALTTGGLLPCLASGGVKKDIPREKTFSVRRHRPWRRPRCHHFRRAECMDSLCATHVARLRRILPSPSSRTHAPRLPFVPDAGWCLGWA
jgi:hypothetical protein